MFIARSWEVGVNVEEGSLISSPDTVLPWTSRASKALVSSDGLGLIPGNTRARNVELIRAKRLAYTAINNPIEMRRDQGNSRK